MEPFLRRTMEPLITRTTIRANLRPNKSISFSPALHCQFSTLLGLDREDRRARKAQQPPPAPRPTRWQIITGQRDAPKRPIKVYPPPASVRKVCKDPIAALASSQLSILDPSGARTRLFAKRNPEAAKVGDILLVRQRNGDPFAGMCLSIRHRGIDTGILLRNNLTRVGVEMWYKIYSPNVEGIEVVQRRAKRARRARLYYMRLPKHDVGSVQNVVSQYLQQRQALRTGGAVRGRDANSKKRGHVKSK